jgi:uncharacterized protein YndB with AHSA1/START domain
MDNQVPARKLTLRRTFQAPAAEVFEAFLSAEALGEWWSPAGFKTIEAHTEAQVGGWYRLVMRSQTGSDTVYVHGTYQEISPPSRLVFTHTFARFEGAPQVAPAGLTGHQTLVTVVFRAHGEATEVVLVQEPIPSAAAEQALQHGWQEILDKLASYLARAGGQDAG